MSTIKQISLFAENKPGRLAKVAEKLGDAKINIRALTVAEAGDFGVIRMVVDKPDEAYRVLHDAGFTVSETEVLGVEMQDEPGGLHSIASTLGESSVNVDYAYAFVTATAKALLILRVDNIPAAIKVLTNAGINLVGPDEVSKI